jgi:hypothetical protein
MRHAGAERTCREKSPACVNDLPGPSASAAIPVE